MFKDNTSSGGTVGPPQPRPAREFNSVGANDNQHRASKSGTPAPKSGGSGKNGLPQMLSHAGVTATKVLHSFNTWAFKREQPADPHLMLQFISEAIALDAPVPFILYWGKGPRSNLGMPDIQCLDYLAALARRVRAVHPRGAAIKLIFTDTHAALNGHSPASMRGYFGETDIKARQHGFDTCWLSHIIRAAEATTISDPADDAGGDVAAARRKRQEMVPRRRNGGARRVAILSHEHGRKARRRNRLPTCDLHHVQRQRFAQPVSNPASDIFYVLASARHERQTLVRCLRRGELNPVTL
jgi:hypothetical protein